MLIRAPQATTISRECTRAQPRVRFHPSARTRSASAGDGESIYLVAEADRAVGTPNDSSTERSGALESNVANEIDPFEKD